MNYAIQCTDVTSGKVGCFGFDTEQYLAETSAFQFRALTPVMANLAALFDWAHENEVELFSVPVVWVPPSSLWVG